MATPFVRVRTATSQAAAPKFTLVLVDRKTKAVFDQNIVALEAISLIVPKEIFRHIEPESGDSFDIRFLGLEPEKKFTDYTTTRSSMMGSRV